VFKFGDIVTFFNNDLNFACVKLGDIIEQCNDISTCLAIGNDPLLKNVTISPNLSTCYCLGGPGWLNELGSWIT
jgi:hypothetical protein